jgi:hypothetical protein
MSIFKTPTPEMAMPPELRQSESLMGFDLGRPTGNVKVAQSYDEAMMLLRPACCGDSGARSIEHVARPRYGHKA